MSKDDVIKVVPNSIIKKDNVNKRNIIKYWSKDYIEERLSMISNTNHRLFITFLWLTGCRVTEAINVRKKDIDFVNSQLRIRWLKSRKMNERLIPISEKLKNILTFGVAHLNDDDKLFPYSRQNAYMIVKRYLGGHPHMLRHSFAINFLRGGGSIEELKLLLGHKYINTTAVYSMFSQTHLKRKLDEIIK